MKESATPERPTIQKMDHDDLSACEETRQEPPTESSARFIVRLTLPVAAVDMILIAIMLSVYMILDKLTVQVWLGAALGFAVSLLDFIAMAVSLLRAEKKENIAAAQLSVRLVYTARMLLILVTMIFALKSGHFDPLATLLPLCIMRLAMKLSEVIRRKGEKSK